MMQVVKDAEPARQHVFNRSAEETITKAMQISNCRAGQYRDSWALENLKTPWLDELLNSHPSGVGPSHLEWKRLVIMASMLDIKLSRLGGGYKEDTAIDTINYLAAYNTLRARFDEKAKSKSEPASHYTANNGQGLGGHSVMREPSQWARVPLEDGSVLNVPRKSPQ